MKTRGVIRTVVCGSMAAVLLATAGPAVAQGVGNLPALPVSFPNLGGGWMVADPNGGSIPVVRDPNGPKWVKQFFDPSGVIVPVPGQVFTVTERLLIAPQLDWSDWHEEILTPGWEWTTQVLILENVTQPPAGLTINNIPGTPTHGGTLEFYFNPLSPGTLLDIRKELVYTGPQGVAFPYIEIAQYPTPEPAGLSLLVVGGLLTMYRRRRGLTA